MIIPFFDLYPYILRELRSMDHESKEYRRNLHKVMMEIGGFRILLNYLKMSDEGVNIRRHYLRNLVVISAMIFAMLVNIGVTVILTEGKDLNQFNNSDNTVFIVFIFATVVLIFFMIILAIRSFRILLRGVSHLISSYEPQSCSSSNVRLCDYSFSSLKRLRNTLIGGIASGIGTVILLVGISVFNLDELPIFMPKPQDFSKAGLTITLNRDFTEENYVTQTAAYCSQKHLVLCIKEEFDVLEELGFDTDISLHEYAESVTENNNIEENVIGDESRPYFIYEDHVSGKDFTYLATVYKGNDAFWTVTFVCETFDFDESFDEFQKWADSVVLN